MGKKKPKSFPEEIILDTLRSFGGRAKRMQVVQVCRLRGLSESQTDRHGRVLEKWGKLKREHVGRESFWTLPGYETSISEDERMWHTEQLRPIVKRWAECFRLPELIDEIELTSRVDADALEVFQTFCKENERCVFNRLFEAFEELKEKRGMARVEAVKLDFERDPLFRDLKNHLVPELWEMWSNIKYAADPEEACVDAWNFLNLYKKIARILETYEHMRVYPGDCDIIRRRITGGKK